MLRNFILNARIESEHPYTCLRMHKDAVGAGLSYFSQRKGEHWVTMSSSTVVRRSARLIAAATLESPGIPLNTPGHHLKIQVTSVNVESMSIHALQGSRV